MPQNPSPRRPIPERPLQAERLAALKVIERFQQQAPVDVGGVAAALEVNVFAEDLGKNVSGILRRDDKLGGKSGYVILVHTRHPLNRQRFTVAHELGHFVLHRDRVNAADVIEEDEFYRAFPGPVEREANEFADDLLMPWSLINVITGDGVKDLPTMAERLGVSKQALAIRLGLPYDERWD